MAKNSPVVKTMADAKAQAAEADRAAVLASKAEVAGLLKRDLDVRFKALADDSIHLLPGDRRRLLESLKKGTPSPRIISGGTVSRWELFRSRLPYRKGSIIMAGLTLSGTLAAVLVAWSHTPIASVVSNYPTDVQVKFALPNGAVVGDTLKAQQAYALVRQNQDEMVLRQWVPNHGYAEAHVPQGWMSVPPAGP